MPNLQALIDNPAAMAELLEEMSHTDPVRAEQVLNDGIRNFEELAEVVSRPPFTEDDDRELAQVYAAARRMTGR
ncbi:hypothetical protein WV31_14325 [Magnetospirillum sp. ME-1]|nr:hypothetical protein WV31_14325 [Magnetospirillum sp. ME-1]